MEAASETRTRRFKSFRALGERARQTFQRFPLVLLSAIAAAAVAHRLADIDFEAERGADALYPVWMACILGISLFFALTTLGESRRWPRRLRLAAMLAGLLALVGYYASLPYPIKGADVTRFFLLIGALHLLVAFAPFIGRRAAENGFWQYNKALFLRFAAGALYSAVLYIGLTLAILACETLLDLDFDDEIYGQLWFWVAFVYNTWFFLAGAPDDYERMQQLEEYPTALRIFTQYVLIPLVVIYLAILYAYVGKIVIAWDLPKGWVGYPVIGVSIVGVLALLLVHPVRERAENRWIVTYGRGFYWTLYPLIGLIAVAIWTRIGDYGITERRYLVVVATAWLLGIALYFTFRRRGDIRVIPITLCLVTALTTVGPWGATAVSRRSQLGRLQALLASAEVMVDGRLGSAPKRIAFEQEKEISNIVKYLHDFHGLDQLRPWYADTVRLPEPLTPQLAMESMGLEYVAPWEEEREGFAVDARPPSPLPVAGYDFVFDTVHHWGDDPSFFRAWIDSVTELRLDGTLLALGPPLEPEARLSVDLAPLIRELGAKVERDERLAPEETVLSAEDSRYRLVMYLRGAGGVVEDDSLRIRHLSAVFLIRLK